jgi:hypothetical protein
VANAWNRSCISLAVLSFDGQTSPLVHPHNRKLQGEDRDFAGAILFAFTLSPLTKRMVGYLDRKVYT